MDRWFYDQVNAYARDKITDQRPGLVALLRNLTIQINNGAPFNVRTAVDDALRRFAVDPLDTIGNLIMWPALDPQYPTTPTTSATGQRASPATADR
jgi:hypothetical protein